MTAWCLQEGRTATRLGTLGTLASVRAARLCMHRGRLVWCVKGLKLSDVSESFSSFFLFCGRNSTLGSCDVHVMPPLYHVISPSSHVNPRPSPPLLLQSSLPQTSPPVSSARSTTLRSATSFARVSSPVARIASSARWLAASSMTPKGGSPAPPSARWQVRGVAGGVVSLDIYSTIYI